MNTYLTPRSGKSVQPLPPCPPTHGLLGDLRTFQRDPLTYLVELGQRFDGVARFRASLWDIYLIAHPVAVGELLNEQHSLTSKNTFTNRILQSINGEGLLTLDGDAWHARRRLMQPIFSKDRIQAFDQIIVQATTEMLARWRAQYERSVEIDAGAEMAQLTLTIASRALFEVELEEDNRQIRQALLVISDVFAERTRSRWAALWGVLGFPTFDQRRLRQSRATLDTISRQIVAKLRRQPTGSNNLLAQLAQAKDEETGYRLSDDELCAEVCTLLTAGHETTARALTWALYLLSRHPAIQSKLRSEADQFLHKNGPNASNLVNMLYALQVAEETLRLYPSAWTFSRRAEHNLDIAGYHIPKGSRIMISPYVTHRLPEFWQTPELFDPERHQVEQKQQRPQHAWMPFGAGPRQCIGRRLAMLELHLILPMIVQHVVFSPIEAMPVLPEARNTLTPARPIRLTVEPK